MSGTTAGVARHQHQHQHQNQDQDQDQDQDHGGHHHEHDGHQHQHGPAPEAAMGPSEAGAVVLDIGAGAGAAVVRTGSDMCGLELEIRRSGAEWDGRHMAIRRRDGAGTPQFAAVFGGLTPGRYELRVRDPGRGGTVLVVDVEDASVRVADWPNGDAAG